MKPERVDTGHQRPVASQERGRSTSDKGAAPRTMKGSPVTTIPLHDAARQMLRAHAQAERDHQLTTTQLRRGYVRTVDAARKAGLRWDQIADALDTTPEAARKMYSRGL